jgi:hypothetical protein
MYNMYALARNSWKYGVRDNRCEKTQLLEFDYLAPDTINETLKALLLLEEWVGGSEKRSTKNEEIELGREILINSDFDKTHRIYARGIESSKRPVEILKPLDGYLSLRELIILYFAKAVSNYCIDQELFNWKKIDSTIRNNESTEWVNIGGQLIKSSDVEELKRDICRGNINSWNEVHNEYRRFGNDYSLEKARHAYSSLSTLLKRENYVLNKENFISNLRKGITINENLDNKTFESREKDYQNIYRQMVYDTNKEMEAVVGELESNSFIRETNQKAKAFKTNILKLIKYLEN